MSGLTQGDGSHLVGETITLNTNNWLAVEINDSDDPNFQDSDNSQSLVNAIVYDGTSYAAGRRVEAEYGLVVEDPDGNSYTIMGFNINEPGVTSYATVEGLAFIGGVGEFPPIGVPLTVQSSFEGPNEPATDYAEPPCFVRGTRIATPSGDRLVENLRVGDLVETVDNGAQEIRWIGQRTLSCVEIEKNLRHRPVCISAGALGNGLPRKDLYTSRQHRFPVASKIAKRMFAADEVLVASNKLTVLPGIFVDERERAVTYFHILFDDHQLIYAEGAPTESLYVGPRVLETLAQDAKQEILALFPELAKAGHQIEPARSIPPRLKQKRLVMRHAKNGQPIC